ncbi:MAG: hypothetical protein ACLQF0_06710 [Dissulfurispiraceae bacterium]
MKIEKIKGDGNRGNVVFAAIRENEEGEWIDVGSIDLLPEMVKEKCKKLDDFIISWAKVNPVKRIVPIKIFEVVEA